MTDTPPFTPTPRLGPGSELNTIYDADYYDRQLHHHHWFHNNAAKRELRWRQVLRMLDSSADDRILEIGCAAGEHVLRLARLCREVVGIDKSIAAVERAEARAVAENVVNARFICLDALNLDQFRDVLFDKIAAIDFVEHVNDETLLIVLRKCQYLLRPRGTLAIFTPCASHYVERLKAHNLILKQIPGHIAVRGPDAYRRLLALGGFAIDSIDFSPSTYPIFGNFDRWLANARILGPLFRFRICIVARPSNVL